ncbi:spermidine synthase [Glycomyces sp. L485]|uniref:spermidine synthase n=1 Tax=Glycomyces sp. L485 TaxID=2909235 RepID=UPI00321A4910
MRGIEELGWRTTPMGEISLRRRYDPAVEKDVYEVKLDEEFLMSSLFTVAEIELAWLGLERTEGDHLDVIVGGLGLGYTAQAALEDPRVDTLTVIEYSDAVIDWHEQDLLPDTAGLAADDRVRLEQADFFAAATSTEGFDPERPGREYDAILLDIDHSPRNVLHSPHAAFYTSDGMGAMSAHLRPGGTFALWSDDPPDDEFVSTLGQVFTDVDARRVWFDNPFTGGRHSNTVYVATKA